MPVTAGIIAAPIIMGAIGNAQASGDRASANAARQQALQQFLSIHVPDPAQQKLIFQRYQQTGQLDPALERDFQQSQTQLASIQQDPSTRAAQMAALSKMSDISDSNGMDAQAKAQTQQAINQANTNAQGQRGAIVQNYAQRGVGGAGAELAAQLQASQGDANQAANVGLQASANSQQRALQAMASGASLAGTIGSQDYSKAAQAAQAQDAINRFNSANSQNVAGANTSRMNDAQKYNVTEGQNISNQNTGVSNTEQEKNQGLQQQKFNDQVILAQGASGQLGNVASGDTANANATANQWAGIGSAIGQAGGAYAQSANNKKATNPQGVVAPTDENQDGT